MGELGEKAIPIVAWGQGEEFFELVEDQQQGAALGDQATDRVRQIVARLAKAGREFVDVVDRDPDQRIGQCCKGRWAGRHRGDEPG